MDFNFSRREMMILSHLYVEGTSTSNDLALLLNVSVRTIKKDMERLRQSLHNTINTVESKPNKGYTLMAVDDEFVDYLEELIETNKISELYQSNIERVFYILRRLLLSKKYIKLEVLADEVYVSRSTLNQDMKKVKGMLVKYNLTIDSKPNYGIIVCGMEKNKRLAISEFVFHSDVITKVTGLQAITDFRGAEEFDLNLIETSLREVTEKSAIVLSDYSIKNISIHILITLIRSIDGYQIKILPEDFEKITTPELFSVMDVLNEKLRVGLGIFLSSDEKAYIFMHIDSKRILTKDIREKDRSDSFENDIKLSQVLDEIFREINLNFDIDISQDELLKQYLMLHIPQMIKRINNNMTIRNPIILESIRNYLFATKVTITSVAILMEYYKVNINLDEFGYLVFYFNMAIQNVMKRKIVTIGLISSRGRSESAMYLNELHESFTAPRYDVVIYDSLNSALIDKDKIDVLVSTTYLRTNEFKKKIFIEDGKYIDNVQKFLDHKDFYNLPKDKYFREENVCFSLKGTTKTEILNNVQKELIRRNIAIKEDTHDKPFIVHEIGNGVAHLQDLYKLCRKPVFFFGVLEEPILWEKSIIEVLVLIKTKKDGDKDLPVLCNLLNKWASDRANIKELVDQHDYKKLLESILQ